MVIFSDVSDRRHRRITLEVSNRFLEIANRCTGLDPLFKAFLGGIKSLTGCRAVGIRVLNEDGTAPFKVAEGFFEAFTKPAETIPVAGHLCACSGFPGAESREFCRFKVRPLSRFDNDFLREIPTCPAFLDESRHWAFASHKFNSVALISIPVEGQVAGMIVVGDRRKNMFTANMVERLEGVGLLLGTAIQRVILESVLKDAHDELEQQVEMRTAELLASNRELKREIEERNQIQQAQTELGRMLEQKNLALKEIIGQIEEGKKRVGREIASNVRDVVLPIVLKMQEAASVSRTKSDRDLVDEYASLIRYHLERVTAPFGRSLADRSLRLTNRELEICSMIKSGLGSKDIVRLTGLTPQTVYRHRKNIRRKLKITGKRITLDAYLQRL